MSQEQGQQTHGAGDDEERAERRAHGRRCRDPRSRPWPLYYRGHPKSMESCHLHARMARRARVAVTPRRLAHPTTASTTRSAEPPRQVLKGHAPWLCLVGWLSCGTSRECRAAVCSRAHHRILEPSPLSKRESSGRVRPRRTPAHRRHRSAFGIRLRARVGHPRQGKVLTQLSAFWFERLRDVIPNHLVSTASPTSLPRPGRFAMCSRAAHAGAQDDAAPIECVARGYLSGSGWKEYQRPGAVCGIRLPAGLRESDDCPRRSSHRPPRRNRATTRTSRSTRCVDLIGADASPRLASATLALYAAAGACERRGIIIADTKFEFGLTEDGTWILIDEALTPDSLTILAATVSARAGPAELRQAIRTRLPRTDRGTSSRPYRRSPTMWSSERERNTWKRSPG